MRRYKYLEKMFLEEMKKVLVFIKGFSETERIKLARMTALWIANNSVQPQVLTVLINVSIFWKLKVDDVSLWYINRLFLSSLVLQEHLVKDGIALEFLIEVFVTWKQEKGLTSLMTSLKKSGLEKRYTNKFHYFEIS